jgi:hypothetical protein
MTPMTEQNFSTTKAGRIAYWIATAWLSLAMLSSGVLQLINYEEGVKDIIQMGYPGYFLALIGAWKILGVITILIPKFTLLKEWAYAGFFFVATGALYSHIAVDHPATEFFGPLLLLVLVAVSWYLRPANRKVMVARQ